MEQSTWEKIKDETEYLDYNVKMVIRRFFCNEDTLSILIARYNLTTKQIKEVYEYLDKNLFID